MEIDALLQSKGGCLDAVRILAGVIVEKTQVDDALSPRSLLDPSTVVMMNRAIRESSCADTPETISQLIEQAGELAQELKGLADQPPLPDESTVARLKQMRAFCLALSEQALAREQEWYDEDVDFVPEVTNGSACVCA